MKEFKTLIILIVVLISELHAQGQPNAPWISYPSANQTQYGVYHFRKTFELGKVPEELIVHVSADNRYNLFVNGERVCYGPAKGDLQTYKYDVIDIASYLKPGKNVLAALVYNGGEDKNWAFISVQTAFFLQAKKEAFRFIDTDASWKVFKNESCKPISYQKMLQGENKFFNGAYYCGPNEEVFADQYPWGFEIVEFDDSGWEESELLKFDGKAPWNLVPRNIPFMDNHLVKPVSIRKVNGIDFPKGDWNGMQQIQIPGNTKASILIDFENFTMGYPELLVKGGKEGSIKVKYAEALYEAVDLKGHRDSVNNLTMYGVFDVYHPDGKERLFRPLWKRVFRYVELEIQTKEMPLTLLSYTLEYSGYPYPEMATFESDNKRLNKVFEMCQRTLKMCSGETYYDTPYYEQLSYGGDNVPIGAISLYNSIDDRLFREMIRLYAQSQNKDTGLMPSSYPSRFNVVQGTWPMAWVQCLQQYYEMRGDSALTKGFVPNIEQVLKFYERHLDESTGLIGTVTAKNFIDWSMHKSANWKLITNYIPRPNEQGETKQSAMLSLYYAYTLDCAVELCKQLGLAERAMHWEKVSAGIKASVYNHCWDEQKMLFRDYTDKQFYSQHTNILAILCDVIPPAKQTELMNRILSYKKFDEVASSYFSFFLFKAMQKTGQEVLILDNLDFWYTFLDRGHNTCGETGFASHDRSDCHAWSAHPAYFLLTSICGIKPDGVGFNEVVISPNMGPLTNIKASMPHPLGRISVDYKIDKGNLKAVIELPDKLSGVWKFGGKITSLHSGINKIN